MKILIVSDTHGKDKYLYNTLQRVGPIELLIHLGDSHGKEEYIKSISPCPVEMVSGNNDIFTGLPKDKNILIGKYKVMLTHGHRYNVYYGTEKIKEVAAARQVDIIMFGHTHVPLIDLTGKIWAINPGSLALPRQRGRIPTFIIMEIDSSGEAHFTLNYYKE